MYVHFVLLLVVRQCGCAVVFGHAKEDEQHPTTVLDV
jgi:hypothetical protein